MRKIILIGGYCAAGKTTFSQMLKRELSIPCYNKDYIKEILGENIGYADRLENRVLSKTTFLLMAHIAREQIVAGRSVILESNFTREDGDVLRGMFARLGCEPLTYLFLGDLRVIYDRFMTREQSGKRHAVHRTNDFSSFEMFREGIEPLKLFSPGGKCIEVDATNPKTTDFKSLMEQGKLYLAER